MIRKVLALTALLVLGVFTVSILAQTEDEIVARYLKKTEKKHHTRTGFFSAGFAYGKLQDDHDYNKFVDYSNGNLVPGKALDGIYRSDQIGVELGFMLYSSLAFKAGFEYWTKFGSDRDNYQSEIQVYGLTGGVDYYLFNGPNAEGRLQGISPRLSLAGGIYFSNWEVWDGYDPINFTTGLPELTLDDDNSGPMKSTAPGITASLGVDVPTPVFELVLSAQGSYQYLNFSKVKAYNSIDDELYASYTDDINDRVELDFSGLRGKIELRRFFQW